MPAGFVTSAICRRPVPLFDAPVAVLPPRKISAGSQDCRSAAERRVGLRLFKRAHDGGTIEVRKVDCDEIAKLTVPLGLQEVRYSGGRNESEVSYVNGILEEALIQ